MRAGKRTSGHDGWYLVRRFLVFGLLSLALGLLVASRARGRVLAPGVQIDRLVVDKSTRELVAYEGERVAARFRVAIGLAGAGPKRWEGDARTPEGVYRIDRRHVSRDYYRFLHVSYPNADDRRRYAAALEAGEVPLDEGGRPVGIGSAIGVHGTGGRDWIPRELRTTLGCVMLDDDEALALYEAVVPNATIEIRP